MSKKQYFIGKLPPPVGGVTVFNQRKFEQLKQNSLSDTIVLLEPTSKNLLKIVTAFNSNNIKHLSASNFVLILLATLFAKKNTIIFYDHNSSRHIKEMSDHKQKIYQRFFDNCKTIALVNEHLNSNYQMFSSYQALEKKFEIISAFLPPTQVETQDILATYPKDILALYNQLKNSNQRNLIITSASTPNLDSKGQDIYSLDKLIEIFYEFACNYPDYYFVIAIAEFQNTEFSNQIESKITRLEKVYPNLIFLKDNIKIWPLFEVTKLLIRATTTDGDSVTVKEALYFGATVLASDVVPRPKEVKLFDIVEDDLKKEIEFYLS